MKTVNIWSNYTQYAHATFLWPTLYNRLLSWENGNRRFGPDRHDQISKRVLLEREGWFYQHSFNDKPIIIMGQTDKLT